RRKTPRRQGPRPHRGPRQRVPPKGARGVSRTREARAGAAHRARREQVARGRLESTHGETGGQGLTRGVRTSRERLSERVRSPTLQGLDDDKRSAEGYRRVIPGRNTRPPNPVSRTRSLSRSRLVTNANSRTDQQFQSPAHLLTCSPAHLLTC